MKLKLAAFLLLVGLTAQAQDKRNSDPGYSLHNYKHANKAAEARRWEAAQQTSVSIPVPTVAAAGIRPVAGNYKRQGGRVNPNEGVVRLRSLGVDAFETNPTYSERNYKRHHRTLSAPDGVARRRRLPADTARQGAVGE
ncbi:MAG: hypothetical protein H7Y12_06705 [Sphingobacteriaceae bacterium]|nr:hypothetical protein [Cytophagaceae bacterium]